MYHVQVNRDENQGTMQYSLKSWTPESLNIQEIIESIRDRFKADSHNCPWEDNITQGQKLLQVVIGWVGWNDGWGFSVVICYQLAVWEYSLVVMDMDKTSCWI